MRYHLCFIIMLAVALCYGCDDSETLTPSDIAEFRYTLPQGSHDYDTRIVEWHNRLGKYMLYKFEPSDVYFSPGTYWQEFYQDTTIARAWYTLSDEIYIEDGKVYINNVGYVLDEYIYGSNNLWSIYTVTAYGEVLREYQVLRNGGFFKVEEAKEGYVGKQLDWIEEMFLDFYSDAQLRQGLPLKLIFGREMYENTNIPTNPQRKLDYHVSFNNLMFSYGDESLDALTQAEKNTIKARINNWMLMTQLISLFTFDEFYAVTNYYWANGADARPWDDECYGLGLVSEPGYSTTDLDALKKEDLAAYIDMILGNSYAKLTATPEDGDYDLMDRTGILDPIADVNGLIREKYDILIGIFNSQGVDIQGIGNLYND